VTFGHRPVVDAGCLRREYLGNDERGPARASSGRKYPGGGVEIPYPDFNGGGWPTSARGNARQTCRASGAAIFLQGISPW
jgi:hypothetical protein